MRIGLQAPRKDPSIAGAATFEQELFEGLIAGLEEHPHTLVIFSQHPQPEGLNGHKQIEWVQIGSIGWRNFAANARRLVNLLCNRLLHWPSPFRDEHWLDSFLRRYRVEFLLNMIPETIPTEVPYLTFIWDLLHRGLPFFPECSQRGAWHRRESQLGIMIRRAAILAVGTETGKTEVMNFYQVPADRIHVLPYPTPRFALAAENAHETPSLGFSGDYVFFPASFHAHKNHVVILYAIAVLRDHHDTVVHAVFSGGDWGNLTHLKALTSKLGLGAQVHFVGFVSREQLTALYRSALALVFASLLGPDNIPPLEAFGLGCPAIVAEIPGAAEQMRGAALLFPPTDEQALASAILQVKKNPEFRDDLVARGRRRAREFTHHDLGIAALRLIAEFEKIRRCWSSEGSYPARYNIKRLFGR